MTDHFQTLGLPRGPVVDQGLLKQRFLEASQQSHPDQASHAGSHPDGAGARSDTQFVAINAAYQCLRETRSRLEHLLVLESGAKPGSIQSMPEDWVPTGADVMALGKGVDQFLPSMTAEAPAMVRSQNFARAMAWMQRADDLGLRLDHMSELLEQEIVDLQAQWGMRAATEEEREARLKTLDRLYRKSSYLFKWTKLVKERQFQLNLKSLPPV